MPSLIALYRGGSIGSAQIVAVSADPTIVADFAERLLGRPIPDDAEEDPPLAAIERGRRRALRLIAREASDRAEVRP
ncbi:MAG TPA: hypothetical protein VFW96_19840 [Thermomicrobiales bacterium]|nr:hypothetical protein [Thermomicrobiales bacterium]